MDIPLQLFGTIETAEETLQAMLCMDVDRPNEAMVHWWGRASPKAVLVRLLRTTSGAVTLEPHALYHTGENGALYIPDFSEINAQYILGFRGTLEEKNNVFYGSWTHTSGKTGRITLSSPDPSYKLVPEVCENWHQFKWWANRARRESNAQMFRGQGSNQFELSTTLSRAGRHRLERYLIESLPELRNHAEAVLDMPFDLNNDNEYSILLGLAQHYGFPTPLLDWTESPYIAAFFAFTDALESSKIRPSDTHVRIYGLTGDFINEYSRPKVALHRCVPHASCIAISARNNPRLYAQQGRFLVTNVADVERFLCYIEKETGTKVLIAADVPIDCRKEALEDLRFMGLTAATMFPGLEGVCRMMKHAMLL